jgi:hypothetical protein
VDTFDLSEYLWLAGFNACASNALSLAKSPDKAEMSPKQPDTPLVVWVYL